MRKRPKIERDGKGKKKRMEDARTHTSARVERKAMAGSRIKEKK